MEPLGSLSNFWGSVQNRGGSGGHKSEGEPKRAAVNLFFVWSDCDNAYKLMINDITILGAVRGTRHRAKAAGNILTAQCFCGRIRQPFKEPAMHFGVVAPLLFSAAFVMSGCTTATYGNKPVPVAEQPNTYAFKIFTGGFAAGSSADKKAEEEFERFRKENGFARYVIVDKQFETFPSGFRYKVRFSK